MELGTKLTIELNTVWKVLINFTLSSHIKKKLLEQKATNYSIIYNKSLKIKSIFIIFGIFCIKISSGLKWMIELKTKLTIELNTVWKFSINFTHFSQI